MKLATPSEMKKIDEIAINQYGIPGILLMENAALQVAKKAAEMMAADRNGRIVAVTGKGNNGGDAFAAIRHLHQWGFPVSIISLVNRADISGDAALFLQILEKTGIEICYTDDEYFLRHELQKLNTPDLILDGIFGTGIHGEVTGIFAVAIDAINNSDARVLSVDIPSGINGRTGQVCGVAVKADQTVTFSMPKPGLWQYPGRAHAGIVTVADIGIPAGAVPTDLPGELLQPDIMSEMLPVRPADGHKGTFGKILVISGSTGMTGSGTLAAKAAFKTGSGLVYLAVPGSLAPIYGAAIPEAITVPQPDCDGVIGPESLKGLLELAQTMDAVVIGPGLSARPPVAEWVRRFVVQCGIPAVIDADALNVLTPEVLAERKSPTVITPHPGEFSRLTGLAISEIQADRIGRAVAFSKHYGVTVVLKGAGTVISCPDGKYSINPSGHSCLAVAGSGDVLAGITGSLIGQGVFHEKAAALAVFIHGRCGEALAAGIDCAGFMAGEICNEIPSVMAELRNMPKEAISPSRASERAPKY